MNGLRLELLDAGDMLDIIHYFFEEDSFRYTSSEQSEAVGKGRQNLYAMYDRTYNYGSTSSGGSGGRKYVGKNSEFDFDSDPTMGTSKPTKPYIPPTQFDPDTGYAAGGVLDAPLG